MTIRERELVEIPGVTGYVQHLNGRTTVLLTLEGNLLQVSNPAVYKGVHSTIEDTP